MNEFLKSIAPTVASALLGPLGGVAVSAIGNLLGVSEPTQQKIATAIADGKLTPEQLSAIKELELKYKADEQERGFRYAELEFKDRDSARQMQIATRSTTPTILTYMLTVGFFGVLAAMMYNPMLKESAPLMIMLGSLGTAWTGACAYWFGSTSGSRAKTDLLAQSSPVK